MVLGGFAHLSVKVSLEYIPPTDTHAYLFPGSPSERQGPDSALSPPLRTLGLRLHGDARARLQDRLPVPGPAAEAPRSTHHTGLQEDPAEEACLAELQSPLPAHTAQPFPTALSSAVGLRTRETRGKRAGGDRVAVHQTEHETSLRRYANREVA